MQHDHLPNVGTCPICIHEELAVANAPISINKEAKEVSKGVFVAENEIVFKDLDGSYMIVQMKDGKKNGFLRKYTADDVCVYKVFYQDDILDGGEEIFSENGTIMMRSSYVKGKKEGAFEIFYPSGAVMMKGDYQKGLQENEMYQFNEFGDLIGLKNYKGGKLNGVSEVYYPQGGGVASREYYVDDKLQGRKETFYPMGNVAEIVDYDVENKGQPIDHPHRYDLDGNEV